MLMCSNITNSGGGDEKLNLFSGDKERRRGKMQFAKTTLQQIKLSTQIFSRNDMVYVHVKVFVCLTALEEKDSYLSKVKVDKVPCFVGDIRAKVAADNAMPSWVVLLVELLLDVRRNILFDVVLFQCLSGAIYSVLLHLLRHVGILDHGFAVRHFDLLSL